MSTPKQPDLDARLRAWPSLDRDDRPLADVSDPVWDTRADAIVAAARAATRDMAAVEVAMRTPDLAPEPGEPKVTVRAASPSGEFAMSSASDGRNPGAPPSGSPSVGPTSGPTSGRPRQSLREMAERASRPPAGGATSTPLPGRASSPGVTATPPASLRTPSSSGATSTPPPSSLRSAVPAISTPIPGVKRAAEGGGDDSGFVDLNIVKATADAAMVAAAEKAKPGESSLFDDEAPEAAKAAPVAAKAGAKGGPAKVASAKAGAAPAKGSSGATTGIVIALLGVAAAFAIWQVRKGQNAEATRTESAPVVASAAPTAAPEATADKPAPVAAATPTAAEDQGLDPSALPDDKAPAGKPRLGGPLPKEAVKTAEAVAEAPKPPVGSKVGDLNSEMRKAVGADGKPINPSAAEPEAAGDTRSKTLPERPSQGAVQAAIGQVLGAAKGCVSEADEATRATVTFNASGGVSSVTVQGWAATNGKSGCVVSALKGAKVSPFSDATYQFQVNIRP